MPVQVVQQLMGRGGQAAPLGGDEVEGALRRRVGQAQHPDVGKQAQVQLRRAGGDDAPAPAAGGQRLRQLGRVGVEQGAGVDTEPVVVPLGDLRLAVDEDLVLRVEGGGLHRLGEGDVLRHDQEEGFPEQGLDLDLQVVVQSAVHNGHVRVAPGHGGHRLVGSHGLHPQGHRQRTLQKPLVHRRQDVLVGGVGGDDVEELPLLPGGEGLGLREQVLPPAGQGQKVLARVGEGDAALALAPVEQRRAHLVLQRPQAGGQGGLGDIQRVRRRGHRAVVQYGEEGLHILIGHRLTPNYSF